MSLQQHIPSESQLLGDLREFHVPQDYGFSSEKVTDTDMNSIDLEDYDIDWDALHKLDFSDLLDDFQEPHNESSPVSLDHSPTEKVTDIALDETHTKLNNTNLSSAKNKGRWTKEEHRQFLIGLERYGNKNWKDIAEKVVLTRTNVQVASHGQKYFLREKASKEKKKRRKSVCDVTLHPNIDQQNSVTTTNFASQQPQEVQQLPHSMPNQMGTFEYVLVDPHSIEQQNWVPYPLQPNATQVQYSSQFNLPNYMAYPMGGFGYLNNGRSFEVSKFGHGHLLTTYEKQKFF